MNRRDFSRLAAASLGAALAPALSSATAHAPEDPWAAGFAQARDTTPWTLGFHSALADIGPQAAVVRGRFPSAVHGVLYRNGPAVHELGGQRYRHWFDGDGMVQRFAISASGVVHRGSIVRTPKYRAEAEAGKRLQAAFGSQWPGMLPIASPDALNAANTSVLPIGDELLALWEGGSAFRLQADTLRTLGPKVWRDDLAGAPFSAHPRTDPDGTIWNFGLSPINDMLVLYQIDRSGRLLKAEAMRLPHSPMLHDFAVTQHHLVFLMPPLIYSPERAATHLSFMDSHVWRPDQPMRVLVVDKADWSRRQWLELPAGFLFHLGNAWEDAAGVIRLDYIHAADPTALVQTDRELMRGRHAARPSYHIACARLDLKAGTASQDM
jgi:all-trans-8'-apo-beta-carotenal 15,15'-oxygenase